MRDRRWERDRGRETDERDRGRETDERDRDTGRDGWDRDMKREGWGWSRTDDERVSKRHERDTYEYYGLLWHHNCMSADPFDTVIKGFVNKHWLGDVWVCMCVCVSVHVSMCVYLRGWVYLTHTCSERERERDRIKMSNFDLFKTFIWRFGLASI